MLLTTPLAQVSNSLRLYAKRLDRLDICTVEDLLYHLPTRYEDYSLVSNIATIQEGENVTLQGIVGNVANAYTRYARKIQKITVSDGTGSIEVTWFNQPYLLNILKKGEKISVSGTIKSFKGNLTLIPDQYEVIFGEGELLHTGRLVPIYPETHGVSSKWLRRQIHNLLTQDAEIEDLLPDIIRKHYNYPKRLDGLSSIHFPSSQKDADRARGMLAFEEVFILNLNILRRRKIWAEKKTDRIIDVTAQEKHLKKFITSLPFRLTSAQDTAVREILKDVSTAKPMNRLLQGDVGSGKTVVAAIIMYTIYLNKLQSVLMAPTEILANQHFLTLKSMLEPRGIRVGIATGSRKELFKKGEFDILVGTHALLNKKIQFENLGLVVIDEQQRFGVLQRGIIREKGKGVHVLTMTATPIPRTVALTLYGDLDQSRLDEMPKGRKIIKTWLVPPEKRNGAYDWIKKEIETYMSQVFIICPFIEDSETMQTVKAATTEFAHLKKEIFPDLRLGLLHGKLKAKEKNAVLKDFKDKKYDVLIATPVVEVGIDIANATVIVIEAAERFGLAQLHQLRGRVGRGDKQSYCLLFTDAKNPQTLTKLRALETIHLGSELAELDFRLRGPGEIYGKLQSGQRMLKIAQFSDLKLLEEAKKSAVEVFPKLADYNNLKQNLEIETGEIVLPD